jgi:signal transduction histidine kinase
MPKIKKSLFYQILSPYILIISIALIIVALYAAGIVRSVYIDKITADLKSISKLLERQINQKGLDDGADNIKLILNMFESENPIQYSYISQDGDVLYAVNIDKAKKNQKFAPEFKKAIEKVSGSSIRLDHQNNIKLLYLATQHIKDNNTQGIIRLAIPISEVDKLILGFCLKIFLFGLSVIAVSIFVSFLIAKRITLPIRLLIRYTQRITRGSFNLRAPKSDSKEITQLANAMGAMGKQLSENIERLTKLERVRKEFVANVSHELKTPITLITGFTETLLEGAIKEPKEALKFLNIIKTHAGRLNAIIEDLLILSKIEQGEDDKKIRFELAYIRPIIERAIATCRLKFEKKELIIEVFCDDDIILSVNPALIEQSVTNLLDNAIKYSPEQSVITIVVEELPDEVMISVQDQGCGIPVNDLARLFQRFYRVDKARSRDQGGTGLGLAIVKHIAHIHNGMINVESKVDEGSNFYMHLPKNNSTEMSEEGGS